jgi:hypothetical protein
MLPRRPLLSLVRATAAFALLPALALALALALAPATRAQSSSPLPSPASHFGFEPGADGKLLTFEESLAYFEKLAAASDRISLERIGTTSFGRPHMLAWIGAAPLLAQKERVLAMLRDVADPRRLSKEREEQILAECPNLLFMSMSMHSTEVGAGVYAPQFAYELVSGEERMTRAIRENVLVAMLPSTNPDGMTMVAEWFRRRKAAGKPNAPLPRLYQKYAGHDNNRDWFMLNLPETRNVTRQLYERIHPLVLLDMHQMGGSGPRYFVPPYADPLNPNLDPILTQALNLLGTRMAHDMTRNGCRGVVTSTTFDNWWNGGNRNVPFRHNILGILTECASANLGDPVQVKAKTLRGRGIGLPTYTAQMNHPDPWPGGTWNLGEIVRYNREAAWSVLRTMALEREEYLSRKIQLGRRAIAAPQQDGLLGYRIARDAGREAAALRLVATLQALGVEVHEMGPQGWFVDFAQPYRAMAKDLLEVQDYPEVLDAPRPHGRPIRPYDASGWTLPLQFGVAVQLVRGERPQGIGALAPRRTLEQVESAATRRFDRTREMAVQSSLQDLDGLRQLFHAHRKGKRAWANKSGELVIEKGQLPRGPEGYKQLRQLAVGLYQSHVSNMDEGWTRYILDSFGVSYDRVSSARVAKGKLVDDFDVILLPSIRRSTLLRGHGRARQLPEFADGIGEKGLEALHDFVSDGGRLVAWGAAVDAVLPIPDRNVVNVLRGIPGRGVSAPGTILRVFQEGSNDADKHELRETPGSVVSQISFTEGLRFDRPSSWGVLQRDMVALGGKDVRALLTYPREARLSGHLAGGEKLSMMAAYGRVDRGKGEYLLMGFRPQNRGQTLATVPLLLRTLMQIDPN